MLDRPDAGLELGHHPRVHALEKQPGLREGDLREQRVTVGPVGIDALDVGEHDEFAGLQCHRERRRRRVGVDVEDLARLVEVGRDGRDHRDPPGRDDVEHRGGVDPHDVADEAEVDLLAVDDSAALARLEQVGVLAGQPDRERAVLVDQADELALHLAGEHHAHDLHDLGRGHPQAALELTRQAHPLEHRPDLRAAAVDDDRMQAGIPEEGDVLGEGGLEGVVGHRVAAVLHDDQRPTEAFQPRQGFDEGGGLACGDAHGGGVDDTTQGAHHRWVLRHQVL